MPFDVWVSQTWTEEAFLLLVACEVSIRKWVWDQISDSSTYSDSLSIEKMLLLS